MIEPDGRITSTPEPRRDALIALVVLTVVTCLFYNEVVFFGRTLLPLDTAGVMGMAGPYGVDGAFRPNLYHLDTGASAWQSEPWAQVVGETYRSGRFPLWNAHQGFGSPLLANGQSGGLDLFRLPVLVSDSALAWDVYYLVRAILGGLAAYLFASTIGLARPARYFLAIAYVFSGHFVLLGNNVWIESYFLLPVVLLGTELVLAGRPRLGLIVTALSVSTSTLVGMPEVTLFVLLAGAGYAGYRLAWPASRAESRPRVDPRAAAIVGGWVVGIALAAPLLLPLFEFSAQSSGRSAERAMLGVSHERLSDFFVWLMPDLLGPPLSANAHFMVGTYVGATVLALALYGLYPSRADPYRRVVPFALVVVTLILAKVYGVPVVNDVGRLPGLDVILFQKWAAPVAAFFLALLASVGVHRLVVEPARPRVASAALVAVASLVMLAAWLNRASLRDASSTELLETVGVALAGAAGVWALAQLGRVVPGATIGFACCALVGVELFALGPRGAYQDRRDPFAEPPFVSFLKSKEMAGPFRVFARDAMLYPNTAGVFGLDDIRSLDALYPDRYMLYVRSFLAAGTFDRYVGAPIGSVEQETRIANNPWFDLTGARYVVTSKDSNDAPGETGANQQYALVYDREARVYENRHALPRAFLVGSVAAVSDASAAIAVMSGASPLPSPNRPRTLTAADRAWEAAFTKAHTHPPTERDWTDRAWSLDFLARTGHPPTDADWAAHAVDDARIDPSKLAVVEGIAPDEVASLTSAGGTVNVRRDQSSDAVIDVDAKGRSFLVLTDSYYPGWQATIDGQNVPIFATDLAFRGVIVPAGQHVVEFAYRPRSFRDGLLIATAGLLALVVALVVHPRSLIRRNAPPATRKSKPAAKATAIGGAGSPARGNPGIDASAMTETVSPPSFAT